VAPSLPVRTSLTLPCFGVVGYGSEIQGLEAPSLKSPDLRWGPAIVGRFPPIGVRRDGKVGATDVTIVCFGVPPARLQRNRIIGADVAVCEG